MLKIELNLSELTAMQIAMLDAVVSALPVPSKVKNQIIDAGYANCGEDEYRKIYMTFCDSLKYTAQELTA